MSGKETVIEAPDFSVLLKAYENKWVAFSADKKSVLSSSDSLTGLLKTIGHKVGVSVLKVLPQDAYYAP